MGSLLAGLLVALVQRRPEARGTVATAGTHGEQLQPRSGDSP